MPMIYSNSKFKWTNKNRGKTTFPSKQNSLEKLMQEKELFLLALAFVLHNYR